MNKSYKLKSTTQAAAHLLSLAGNTMPYLKLMKLLYLADRESFLQTECAISGDRYVSMKNGPVLSQTYDLIKGVSDNFGYWQKHIETRGYTVRLIDKPGKGDLSPLDMDILQGIYQKYGHLNRWDLVNLTHQLPEWEDPGSSSRPIRLEKLLAALGFDQQSIQRICTTLEYDAKINQILG